MAAGSTRPGQISHTLSVQPSPKLTPREVVITQAYALHCGRVDVCFRFASPLNKLMTGPFERFARLFEAPSRYSAMLGCERFFVEEDRLECSRNLRRDLRQTFVVTFWNSESPRSSSTSQSYMWELSLSKVDSGECWCTDSVVPIDMESFWDGSLLED
ncbi:Hypothetical protein SCF082_LOCUS44118 [Durusdinium trenchii]|uniref:Uncharacterized protein n=1 Tax=Durusdinium trenchii TaxID=1381693 RepID=A0ABP0QZU6_9DINO